jgi:flagellar biosynthesis chaperone FliJ
MSDLNPYEESLAIDLDKAQARIEELKEDLTMAAVNVYEVEDKLNKAIDALEKVQAFVRDLEPHADQGHTLVPALREACETLAELKGYRDE